VRRRAYFLSGFDPRGASHYYRLFGEQLRRHGRRQGQALSLGRRRGLADGYLSRWSVANGLELTFLHWDDIAREHWPRRPWPLLRDVAIFGWWYLVQGGFLRFARMSPPVALCGLYPVMFAVLSLLMAVLMALLVAAVVHGLAGGSAWAIAMAAAAAAAVLVSAWRWADQLGVVWLFRSIRFTHHLGQARDGGDGRLRVRVQELAQRLVALEAQEPAGEVVLVGHSSGSFVLAMLAAELRRQPAWPALAGRVRLLTLGQNLANLAVHGRAERFHQDLLELAQEPRPPWLDVTSADDYLCFAGVDPYRTCGLPVPPAGPYPALQLVDWATPRGIRNWWQLMGCQFDLHFDYLRCAGSTAAPVGFDLWTHLLEGLDG